MGEISEFHERHHGVINKAAVTGSQKVAVMGLEKMGLKTLGHVVGKVVTPAIWVWDYSKDGKLPDKTEVGLFGFGVLVEGAEGPALAVEFLKAAIDDDIENKLKQVRQDEEPQYRKFIKACYNYGMSPPLINAQTIATRGGTAWRHKNGLWVYIEDIHGHPVANFKPHNAVAVFQPDMPLRTDGNGKFYFHLDGRL